MSEKDLSKALRNIIEKELKGLSKILPKDVISNIEKKNHHKLKRLLSKVVMLKSQSTIALKE